jgi:hypothetical protein
MPVMAARFQRDSSPTQSAFQQLLGWLDEGVDSRGEKYLEMRRRLVQYFDRKGCARPDDLADEALNRVARRLGEEGGITNTPPPRYCYIVAKFILLEYLRSPAKGEISLDTRHVSQSPAFGDRVDEDDEKRRQCLERLKREERDLILEYYRGEQREKIDGRRTLAAKLGLTANALKHPGLPHSGPTGRVREELLFGAVTCFCGLPLIGGGNVSRGKTCAS